MDYYAAACDFFLPGNYLVITPAASTAFIFILILLFLVSFLLSGAQVAYFSLSIRDINYLKTRPQMSYKRIVTLLQYPKALYTSILIGNVITNISIILIANLLLDQWLSMTKIPDGLIVVVKILIITIILVLFAEILPKVWASYHKVWFASASSMTVEMTTLLLGRISRQIVRIDNSIQALFKNKQKEDIEHDDDINLLSDEDASTEEKNILKGIRRFGNTTVKQTMRTRLDVKGIEYHTTFPQVLKLVSELIYSRIPVYKGNLDEISGILHTKDLLPHLKADESFEWQTLIKPAHYVHEQKLIEGLLQEFRANRIHLAVVVDEFGGTSGIITLEDVIEEIVGDIQDEFDFEENQNFRLDNHNFVFEGKTMINDACRLMNITPSVFDGIRGDSDSLAGLVLEVAGDFPRQNSEISYNGFTFKPTEISKNRILKIQVTIPDETKNETT